MAIYPSVGLYCGYGEGDKIKSEGMQFGTDITGEVNFFDNNTNKLDMGVTTGLNLQYRSLVFTAGFDHGFMRLNKQSRRDENALNSNFRVSIGVLL